MRRMTSPSALLTTASAAALVVLATFAPTPPSSLAAQSVEPEVFDGVRAMIQRVMAERNLASVSVAAARDGQVVWEESFGWADREARIEATPHTLPDFLRNEVFLPLGLTRTSVGLPPVLRPFAATRYGPDGRPIPFYEFDHDGASAVWSSAHDLIRFGLFHLGHVPEGGAGSSPTGR